MHHTNKTIKPNLPDISVISDKSDKNESDRMEGFAKIQTFDRINEGGFGVVYRCKNINGQDFAVKSIKNNEFGISCLAEAFIMSHLNHPCINKALQIHIDSKKLYMIQEIAINDLKSFIQTNNHICRKLYISWFNMLIQSVNYMHIQNIVHGDIKASNILIYKDLSIKLTDFTLSKHINWHTNRSLYTITHRPYECWFNKSVFTFKSDIWALGCTLYEILIGELLFIPQKYEDSIYAILDWAKSGPNKEKLQLYQPKTSPNVQSYNLINEDTDLLQFIFSLLYVDPDKRPSCLDLLNNNLFSLYTPQETFQPILFDISDNTLQGPIKDRIKNILSNPVENILNMVCSIYMKIKNMSCIYSDKIKIQTCYWIAHKLIHNIPPAIKNINITEIISLEQQICLYLKFKFTTLHMKHIF